MFDFHHIQDPAEAKKLRERHALDSLQRLHTCFPAGAIRRGLDGREPDFVVESCDSVIGIEVVELFRDELHAGTPIAAQEAFTFEIADAVTVECQKAGLKHVYSSLVFDYRVRLDRNSVTHLASWLIPTLQPVARGERKSLRLISRRELPPGVSEMWAYHRALIEDPYVGPSWGGLVPPAKESAVRRLIAGKEDKRKRIYSKTCSEVWLLIVVDPYKVASMAYVAPVFKLGSANFDRVIVLQGWNNVLDLWNKAAA